MRSPNPNQINTFHTLDFRPYGNSFNFIDLFTLGRNNPGVCLKSEPQAKPAEGEAQRIARGHPGKTNPQPSLQSVAPITLTVGPTQLE